MSFILKGLLLGLIAEVTVRNFYLRQLKFVVSIRWNPLQNSKIIMNKVIYNSDNSNANVSAIVWSINDHSFLNVSAETFVDLDKIVMSFVFAVCRNENDKNYENVLVRSTLNSCKVNEGNRGNFMIKMAMADFDSTADFKWTCPFYKVI